MNVPCHAEVHSESNVPDQLWDWWNDDQQRQWLQVQPWNNDDPAPDINKITVGINGITGMPMIGINGHLGLLVALMIGGRRGHNGTVNQKKYFDKSPPPEWDGNHPEKTWRDYRRTLKQWSSTTDVPSEKHSMLLWRALTGDAKLLISHFRNEDLLHWDAWQRIFDVVAQAHKHISEFEDQDDFDNALYKLHRHIMAKTNGLRNFSHPDHSHRHHIGIVRQSTAASGRISCISCSCGSHMEIRRISSSGFVPGSLVFGVWVLAAEYEKLDLLGDDFSYVCNAWFDSEYMFCISMDAFGEFHIFSTAE